MKYFLDIDGVMVKGNMSIGPEMLEDGFYRFEDDAVDSLNSVLEPEDEIIISSSHRFSYSVANWKKILERRGILNNNVSIVEMVHHGHHQRLFEIVKWVMERGFYPEEVVIVDDDKSLNELPKELKERLVLTNSFIGLQSPDEFKYVLNG